MEPPGALLRFFKVKEPRPEDFIGTYNGLFGPVDLGDRVELGDERLNLVPLLF